MQDKSRNNNNNNYNNNISYWKEKQLISLKPATDLGFKDLKKIKETIAFSEGQLSWQIQALENLESKGLNTALII